MFIRIALIGLAVWLFSAGVALASPFDDMTADEIFSRDDFVRSTDCLSNTTNAGDPDAPHVYYWVGYIEQDAKRFYFTSFGEALTCVKWAQTGEWVPEWVADALQKLTDKGIIKFNKLGGTES
jgi:hypothetical protein